MSEDTTPPPPVPDPGGDAWQPAAPPTPPPFVPPAGPPAFNPPAFNPPPAEPPPFVPQRPDVSTAPIGPPVAPGHPAPVPPTYSPPGSPAPPWGAPPQYPQFGVAPQGPAPTPTRRGRWKWVWVGLAFFAMVCLAGAGVSYWLSGRSPDHPDAWDPRVTDLVDFVETDRGHDFDHPVQVNFLSPEEYSQATSGDGKYEPTDEEQADADDQTALFRALGLMTGDVDLIESSNDLFEDGTAAFYDSETEQVYVNGVAEGEEMSPATAVTVVHELTHALQDQMVDLDSIDDDIDSGTTDWADAHLAIVEGDAMVVEQNYVDSLSDDDFDAYMDEWNQLVDDADTAKADAEVPQALDIFFGLPYVFGPSWVVAAQATDGGQDQIDRALDGDVPPSVAILDLTVDGPPALSLDTPRVSKGSEELYTDSLGAMSWLVVLGEHTDSSTAIDATSTWKGDEMVVFRDSDDRVCFNAHVEVDSRGAAVTDGPFATAARAWAAALPAGSSAKVAVADDRVELRACDPGPDVEVPLTGQAQEAVDELGLRNSIVTSVLADGDVSVEWAECYAEGLIEAFGVEELNTSETLVDSPEFAREATAAAIACDEDAGD